MARAHAGGFVVVAATAVSSACAGPNLSIPHPVEIRDSAGVTLVENGALDLDRELLADSRPLLEIGVLDGTEGGWTARVADAKRLADGAIAVTTRQPRELKIFEADGSHRVTVGGTDEGSVTFLVPGQLRVLGGDSIMVQDYLDRVWLTTGGELLGRARTTRTELMGLGRRFNGHAERGQWISGDRFFTQFYELETPPWVAGPADRPRMTFVVLTADFSFSETLGVFLGVEEQYIDVGDEWPSSSVPPFGRNTSWSVGGADGKIVVGDNARAQIEIFEPHGRRTLARWAADTVALTRAEVDAWMERRRLPPHLVEHLPEWDRGTQAVEIPETKPHFGHVGSGSDGRIWLGPPLENPQPWAALVVDDDRDWLVFGADGRYLGTASLPARFRVMDSGTGWVLGAFRDASNAEFLQLYGLRER